MTAELRRSRLFEKVANWHEIKVDLKISSWPFNQRVERYQPANIAYVIDWSLFAMLKFLRYFNDTDKIQKCMVRQDLNGLKCNQDFEGITARAYFITVQDVSGRLLAKISKFLDPITPISQNSPSFRLYVSFVCRFFSRYMGTHRNSHVEGEYYSFDILQINQFLAIESLMRRRRKRSNPQIANLMSSG